MLAVAFACATGFLFTAPLSPRTAVPRRASICMEESEYERYIREKRSEADMAATDAMYKQFKGIDQEFDGGDSGGGAVGDGNVDLEDQHNSATLGALRGGVSDLTGASMNVGRGNVLSQLPDEQSTRDGSVDAATNARTASAGKNYFGRSTGLAEKIIDNISEDDVKNNRVDCVRAQQKENWFNQRAIHKSNREAGQGVVYGDKKEAGHYIAREALERQRQGTPDGEVSQRDLANHMAGLAAAPAERLDGEEWGELILSPADELTEVYEVRSNVGTTHVTEIAVRNDYNTFAPYRVVLMPGSSVDYDISPRHGSMNRRSGEPVNLMVRYTPREYGATNEALIVFETEDMRKIYKFIGST